MATHIPVEEIHTFQVCCVKDCVYDAEEEYEIARPDKQVFYLAACAKHVDEVYNGLCDELSGRKKPENVKGIALDNLFVQCPENAKMKMKYLVQKGLPCITPPPPPPGEKEEAPTQQQAVDAWEWVYDDECWMDVGGKVVPLSNLHGDELISSILGIAAATYVRTPKWLRWIKNLIPPKTPVVYPIGCFEQAAADIRIKLEEFEEEAEARGLL